MKVQIYGNNEQSTELFNLVQSSLEELWLSDFIELETTFDEIIKTELDIKEVPALIIIEESIDFKDIIFEWLIPPKEEIKSMLISIIGWSDDSSGSSCAPGWCGSWCSC